MGMASGSVGGPKCLSTYPRKGFFMITHSWASRWPSHRVNVFRSACDCKGLTARATRQAALGSTCWLQSWLPGERLCLEEHRVPARSSYFVLCLSRAGTKILGAFSFSVVSATVSDPYFLESQTQLTQMVILFGRCPEL